MYDFAGNLTANPPAEKVFVKDDAVKIIPAENVLGPASLPLFDRRHYVTRCDPLLNPTTLKL
jgi:hypothetical protein